MKMFQIVLIAKDDRRRIEIPMIYKKEANAHTLAKTLSMVTDGSYEYKICELTWAIGEKE